MTGVTVAPALLQWAVHRAGWSESECAHRAPRLETWIRGTAQPTWRQLETFAAATYVPFGYFFLDKPPEERLPIMDFRTRAHTPIQPSAALLDTIYLCQQRQATYSEEAEICRYEPCEFVGNLRPGELPTQAAQRARQMLGFEPADRPSGITSDRAFAWLSGLADRAGILVMVSGIVGSNTHRLVDPDEFRGFALVDRFAPVIFINGNDPKAAQLFTLAHELGHLWRGESGVSNEDLTILPKDSDGEVERWCDEFAAELLVPRDSLRTSLNRGSVDLANLAPLAQKFAVSEAVLLRRLADVGAIEQTQFHTRIPALLKRPQRRNSSGGNFYATLQTRVSRRFAQGIVVGTLEGRIPYTRALRLLGFKKLNVFDELARRLEVVP